MKIVGVHRIVRQMNFRVIKSSLTGPLHPLWCSAFGSRVRNFEVLPQILGVNPQICHKILELTLNFSQKESQSKSEDSGFWNAKFGYRTHDSSI